jgi:phosphate transport system permease protein
MSVQAPDRPSESLFPDETGYQRLLAQKTRKSKVFELFALSMLTLAVLALATLLYTIVNDAFGLVAVVNEREPEAIVAEAGYDLETTTLGDLDKDELVALLEGAVERGVGRRFEREQRFYSDRLVFETQEVWDEICAEADAPTGCTLGERDQPNVFALVQERVVVPDIIASYDLVPSLLSPEQFRADVESVFQNDPGDLVTTPSIRSSSSGEPGSTRPSSAPPPTRHRRSPASGRRSSGRPGS